LPYESFDVPSQRDYKTTSMNKSTFTEKEIPYNKLEEYGLTHQMVDDFPQNVMRKLLNGGFTPILPLSMKTDADQYDLMARIALRRGQSGEINVLLKTKIEPGSINLYPEEQQEALKKGKVIMAESPSDLISGEKNGLCFVQFDEETNQVLSVPTYAIGQNIRTLADTFGLDYEVIKNLQNGEPQSVEWDTKEGNRESLAFGIDLKEELGIRIVNGGIKEWMEDAKDFKEKYNFGIYGVWISDEKGVSGKYVPEEEYTEEIQAELQRAGNRNRAGMQMGSMKM